MNQDVLEKTQLPDGFYLLIRRLQRGVVIFRTLYLLFAGSTGVALILGLLFHGWIPWALVAFMASLSCRLAVLLHVGPRYVSARKVLKNPQIVYWGHSIDGRGQFTDTTVVESPRLKLHLKNGAQLQIEVVRGTGTSQEQLREVVLWLRNHNPSIRWGDYDNPCV